MAATLFAHAKTGGPAGPKVAAARFSVTHFDTRWTRQSVARRVGLTTLRQNWGTSAVKGDLLEGSPSQGRRVVSLFRIPLQAAGREVFP